MCYLSLVVVNRHNRLLMCVMLCVLHFGAESLQKQLFVEKDFWEKRLFFLVLTLMIKLNAYLCIVKIGLSAQVQCEIFRHS